MNKHVIQFAFQASQDFPLCWMLWYLKEAYCSKEKSKYSFSSARMLTFSEAQGVA